jgi:hypothetical protein
LKTPNVEISLQEETHEKEGRCDPTDPFMGIVDNFEVTSPTNLNSRRNL